MKCLIGISTNCTTTSLWKEKNNLTDQPGEMEPLNRWMGNKHKPCRMYYAIWPNLISIQSEQSPPGKGNDRTVFIATFTHFWHYHSCLSCPNNICILLYCLSLKNYPVYPQLPAMGSFLRFLLPIHLILPFSPLCPSFVWHKITCSPP